MEMLVHDLLAYTQASQASKALEPMDETESLENALTSLQGALVESGARVEFDRQHSVPVERPPAAGFSKPGGERERHRH
jgi:light-regulated signal transduction histidine kinase (bacteriophytochrome)